MSWSEEEKQLRRLEIRAARLQKLIAMKGPELFIGRERTLVQQAVDGWVQVRGDLEPLGRHDGRE